jgi:hypothetical protein
MNDGLKVIWKEAVMSEPSHSAEQTQEKEESLCLAVRIDGGLPDIRTEHCKLEVKNVFNRPISSSLTRQPFLSPGLPQDF